MIRTVLKIARPSSAALLLIGWLQMLGAAPILSQQETGDPSASLLRRLAEAADGHRTGQPVWIVLGQEPPHELVGVYDDRFQADSARAAAVQTGLRYRVEGPIVTPQDFGQTPKLYPLCHDPPTKRRVCLVQLPRPAWSCDDIRSVTVTLEPRDDAQTPLTFSFEKCAVDAIFLTVGAIDKFYLPYITHVEGPAAAVGLRAQVEAYVRQ